MAYAHCHTKGCSFSQDDFWTLRFKPQLKFWRWRSVFGFNPVTCFLEDINWLIKPRWMGFDKWIIDEIEQDHGYRVWSRIIEKEEMIDYKKGILLDGKSNSPIPKNGSLVKTKRFQVFSWSLLVHDFRKMLRKLKEQHWWTYEAYKKSNRLCPKCGSRTCVD